MHELFVGITMSGKTTLARTKAGLYTSAGRHVIVLDPLMDPAWKSQAGAVLVTDDPDEFLRVYWASRNCAAFIDESGDAVGRYNKPMNQTATKGRHWGHINHYILQRPNALDVTVRSQCTEVYAFRLSPKDAEILAEDFVQPELMGASRLNKGEYIHASGFGQDGKPFVAFGNAFTGRQM
jgi:hypothetical protein